MPEVLQIIKALKTLKYLLAALIIIGMVWYVGLNKIITTLLSANPLYVILAGIITVLIFGFAGLNIKLILRHYNYQLTWWECTKTMGAVFGLVLLLPSRAGDLSLVYFLKKKGVDESTGSAVMVMDKFVYFIVLGFFTAIGCFIFLPINVATYLLILLLLFFTTFTIALLTQWGSNKIIWVVNKVFKKLDFNGYLPKVKNYFKDKKVICANITIITIRWLCKAVAYSLMFLAFDIHIAFWFIVMANAVEIFMSFMPFTPGGIGLKEGASVYLYGIVGVAPHIVLSVFFILMALAYIEGIAWMVIKKW